MPVVFLTLDEVLALHADQVARYGGRRGVRPEDLLRSARAVPASPFGGGYLHGSVPEMAGAYLFHLVRNHPFVDGNKRTGLMAMLVFLGLSGLRLDASEDELTERAGRRRGACEQGGGRRLREGPRAAPAARTGAGVVSERARRPGDPGGKGARDERHQGEAGP